MTEKLKRLRVPQRTKHLNIMLAVALMGASMLGITVVLAANDHTEEYLVAAEATASGSLILNSNLTRAKFNLGESANLYLKPEEMPEGGYLLFSMAKGQLIPRASIATQILDAREPVVLTSTMPLASRLKAGDAVDIWVSALTNKNTFQQPVVLVINAEITDVRQPTGMFASQQPEVQLLVPRESVGPILDAIASKDAISLVQKRNLGND